MLKATGLYTYRIYQSFLHTLFLAGEMVACVKPVLNTPKKSLWQYFEECYKCGPKSIIPIAVVTFLFGTVLVAISGAQFRSFGLEIYVANLVGIAAARELAPILSTICLLFLVAARFTNEVAMIKTINKELFCNCLIKIFALASIAPLLSLFALYFIIAGGAVTAVKMLGLGWSQYWDQIFSVVPLVNVVVGLIKAIIFGIEIAFIGCFYGIIAHYRHRDLGNSMIRSISMGIVVVAVSDSLMEFIFHFGF